MKLREDYQVLNVEELKLMQRIRIIKHDKAGIRKALGVV